MFVAKPVSVSQTQLILRTAGYICTFISGFDQMALVLYGQNILILSAPRQCLNRCPMIFSILSIFKWNFLIISEMKYVWWHTCNKMLLIIEKQLVRTINIKLGDVELNLQKRKYCFYFSVGECMLLSNMLILKKILFIKILKIGTIWTFASKMMKETYLSLFFLLCRSQNPGCFKEKTEEVSER